MREELRRIYAWVIVHIPHFRKSQSHGCADDHRRAMNVIVDAQFAGAVRADQMRGGTRVLGEAHMRKILKLAPERSCPPITSVSFIVAQPIGSAPCCWSASWRARTRAK